MNTKSKKKKKPPSEKPQRSVEQPALWGLDVESVKGFPDLSEGLPVKDQCPRCGYTW